MNPTQSISSSNESTAKPRAKESVYSVEVMGFSETERIVLGSIFRLSARRNPTFVQFAPGEHKSPDIYLLDADDARCETYLGSVAEKGIAPIVLVGASAHGTRHLLVPRPLRWTRTLEIFEEVMNLTKSQLLATHKSEHVLVVDDSYSVRKFMESKLAPYSFDVDYADSGEQAIGLVGRKRYTCVFLDVMLPGVDGYQVCKTIKARKTQGKPTAVVMLTSKTSPFDKIRATMAGSDAYLTKPVDEEKLLEVISKFLPSRKPAPEASEVARPA